MWATNTVLEQNDSYALTDTQLHYIFNSDPALTVSPIHHPCAINVILCRAVVAG